MRNMKRSQLLKECPYKALNDGLFCKSLLNRIEPYSDDCSLHCAQRFVFFEGTYGNDRLGESLLRITGDFIAVHGRNAKISDLRKWLLAEEDLPLGIIPAELSKELETLSQKAIFPWNKGLFKALAKKAQALEEKLFKRVQNISK